MVASVILAAVLALALHAHGAAVAPVAAMGDVAPCANHTFNNLQLFSDTHITHTNALGWGLPLAADSFQHLILPNTPPASTGFTVYRLDSAARRYVRLQTQPAACGNFMSESIVFTELRTMTGTYFAALSSRSGLYLCVYRHQIINNASTFLLDAITNVGTMTTTCVGRETTGFDPFFTSFMAPGPSGSPQTYLACNSDMFMYDTFTRAITLQGPLCTDPAFAPSIVGLNTAAFNLGSQAYFLYPVAARQVALLEWNMTSRRFNLHQLLVNITLPQQIAVTTIRSTVHVLITSEMWTRTYAWDPASDRLIPSSQPNLVGMRARAAAFTTIGNVPMVVVGTTDGAVLQLSLDDSGLFQQTATLPSYGQLYFIRAFTAQTTVDSLRHELLYNIIAEPLVLTWRDDCPASGDDSKGGLPTWAIVMVSAVSFLLLCMLVLVVYRCTRMQLSGYQRIQSDPRTGSDM